MRKYSYLIFLLVIFCSVALAGPPTRFNDGITTTRMDVDNIRGDGNTISTTNTNGDLTFDLNGTGSVIFNDLNASTVLTLDASKKLKSSSVTPTTLSYLDINSSLTTQLAAKADLISPTLTTPTADVITFDDQGSTPANPSSGYYKLYAKTDGKFYTLNSIGTETEVGSGSGSDVSNFQSNGGYEVSSPAWSSSGGTLAAATSGSGYMGSGYGLQSATWDSSGSGQTLTLPAYTIGNGAAGTNGLFRCKVRTPSGTATHTMGLWDGTTLTDTITIPSSTTAQYVEIAKPFGAAAATVAIRFTSVNSNEPLISIDDCYIGRNFNLSDVSASYYLGTETWVDSQTNATTSVRIWRSNSGIRVEGVTTFTGTSSGATNITIPAAYAADSAYVFTNNKVYDLGLARFIDAGTGSTEGKAVLTAATTIGLLVNDTASTYLNSASTTSSTPIAVWANNDTIIWSAEWAVSGWTAQSAVRVENYNWRVDASISGANASLGTANVSTYTGVENGSLTLTNATGKAILNAQIPCSSTNAPSGTTCLAGNESVGISFDIPAATDALACVSFGHGIDTDSVGDAIYTAFQIVETPSNAQTISQEGKSRINSGTLNPAAGGHSVQNPVRVCGTFTFTSGGQKTLRLMYEQLIASTPTGSNVIGDASTAQGQRDIHWEVYPISNTAMVPLLVGSVTSNSTGLERVERVRFSTTGGSCSGSPCTIDAQSGSWVSSVSRGGTGSYTINIPAGIFSAAPTCTCSAYDTVAAGRATICTTGGSPTATAVTVESWRVDASGSLGAVNAVAQVICMGPR